MQTVIILLILSLIATLIHSSYQLDNKIKKRINLCRLAIDYHIQHKPVEKSKPVTLKDYIDINKHRLIVGKTGSGKSNVLMSQIINCIAANHDIYIVDVKRELRPLFKKYAKQIVNVEGAQELFNNLLGIADERMELFSDTSERLRKPCRDIGEYKRLTGQDLPYINLIVEELVYLLRVVDEAELIKLLVIGRSSGVYILCASQYMKADILSREGLINFNIRAFLGKYDRIACQLIFNGLDKEEMQEISLAVGRPGIAAIQTDDSFQIETMPRVEDTLLERFM